ncbi:hypothetical protein SGRIM119S_03352 [Streptomyces griseorubiginosus]
MPGALLVAKGLKTVSALSTVPDAPASISTPGLPLVLWVTLVRLSVTSLDMPVILIAGAPALLLRSAWSTVTSVEWSISTEGAPPGAVVEKPRSTTCCVPETVNAGFGPCVVD